MALIVRGGGGGCLDQDKKGKLIPTIRPYGQRSYNQRVYWLSAMIGIYIDPLDLLNGVALGSNPI